MNPDDIRPGPIRRAQLSPELLLRIQTVRTAVADVCPLSETEWSDALQRDANPERELSWWERVAGCYVTLIAARTFSPDQKQAAFNVIFGLFSGFGSEELQADLAKLPDSVMDDLEAIVAKFYVN